jgi:MFS family permease
VNAYRELFGHRDARWPLLTSTVSRLTPGMIVFAILLLMRDVGYAYTAIGLVVAGHQIGVGLGSPLQGRLADRFGQVQVLVPDAALYLSGTVVLALLALGDRGVGWLLTAAVLTGAAYPPVTACSRVLLSRLFPTGQLRETAFAVSTISVELGFVVGPLAAAGVALALGPAWSVVLAGVAAAAGAASYSATAMARAMPRRDASSPRVGALRSPGVRFLAVAIGLLAVTLGVFEIVVPAVAELAGHSAAAGSLLLSAVAVGSLVGGLVYGGRAWPGTLVQRVRLLVPLFAVGLLLVPLATGNLVLFGIALLLGGVCLAPALIVTFQLLDDSALPGTQTEAQSWLQTAVVFGISLGAAASGTGVDLAGPSVVLLLGAGFAAISAGVVNLAHGALRPTEALVVAPTHR